MVHFKERYCCQIITEAIDDFSMTLSYSQEQNEKFVWVCMSVSMRVRDEVEELGVEMRSSKHKSTVAIG